MSSSTIAIAGAGLLGRLMAWRLARDGHRVSVFDAATGPEPSFDAQGSAAFSSAGMLSPLAELDHADASLAELGWRSIARWREIAAELELPAPCFAQRGSLLLAHRGDLGAARRVLDRIAAAGTPSAIPLDTAALRGLEPALIALPHAWLLPDEAQIDPLATLAALQRGAPGVQWHWGSAVASVEPHRLQLADGSARRFDTVFDLRGLGSRSTAAPSSARDFTDQLRGVRGETVWLHAPGHGLTRPLRLLHPRHRVYLVPRAGDIVFVGATEIESEDRSPVSLRSALELMSAAHSVLPALAEARILRLDRHLRPALPDHLPRIEVEPGRVRINGLYRHGWLLAPALVDDALRAIEAPRNA